MSISPRQNFSVTDIFFALSKFTAIPQKINSMLCITYFDTELGIKFLLIDDEPLVSPSGD